MMPTYEAAILVEARRVARLQRQARVLKTKLKQVNNELRLAKRDLRKIVNARETRFDMQMIPLKVFGETQS
jgi:hypothetical protein